MAWETSSADRAGASSDVTGGRDKCHGAAVCSGESVSVVPGGGFRLEVKVDTESWCCSGATGEGLRVLGGSRLFPRGGANVAGDVDREVAAAN